MSAVIVDKVNLSLGGLHILNNISLTAEPANVTAVIGPNGAGKTTLFNVVSGFMPADSGTITCLGEDTTGMLPEQVCRYGLARTFQKVRGLPSLTVRDNVTVGALNRQSSVRDTVDRVDEILSDVGLLDYADLHPPSLSVGLRKRLEVARVLATEPKVVLLDEVMGGLVSSEVRQMMTYIGGLAERGITVILVEHHMEAVMQISDKVVVINEGKNLAEGSPREVSRDPLVLEAYLGEEFGDAAG